MKNLSLLLNGILIIAVGILYYLHFNEKSMVRASKNQLTEKIAALESAVDNAQVAELPQDSSAMSGTAGIAYIDMEEFFAKYAFYKQGVAKIQRGVDSRKSQLMAKQKKLEDEYKKYQETAPALGENYRKQKEQQLMQQEQELYQLRDKLEGEQSAELTKFNEKLLAKLSNYLKDLGQKKNYNYVFTYVKGGPSSIVYAKDSLNITKKVLQSLNAVYLKKK